VFVTPTELELVLPPSLERYWKLTALIPVTPTKTLAALAFRLARIMTPACALVVVVGTVTGAVMLQLLLAD
jgi:hypothetical protein